MTTKQIISDLKEEISDTKCYISQYLDKSCNDDAPQEKIGLEGFIEGLEFTIEKLQKEHDECL